jgi:hypothetical protein
MNARGSTQIASWRAMFQRQSSKCAQVQCANENDEGKEENVPVVRFVPDKEKASRSGAENAED